MANYCDGLQLPWVSIHNEAYCRCLYCNTPSDNSICQFLPSYNMFKLLFFLFRTEQKKPKTLLGCSSCSIDIGHRFHTHSLPPQFKESSNLRCKNQCQILVLYRMMILVYYVSEVEVECLCNRLVICQRVLIHLHQTCSTSMALT